MDRPRNAGMLGGGALLGPVTSTRSWLGYAEREMDWVRRHRFSLYVHVRLVYLRKSWRACGCLILPVPRPFFLFLEVVVTLRHGVHIHISHTSVPPAACSGSNEPTTCYAKLSMPACQPRKPTGRIAVNAWHLIKPRVLPHDAYAMRGDCSTPKVGPLTL